MKNGVPQAHEQSGNDLHEGQHHGQMTGDARKARSDVLKEKTVVLLEFGVGKSE